MEIDFSQRIYPEIAALCMETSKLICCQKKEKKKSAGVLSLTVVLISALNAEK